MSEQRPNSAASSYTQIPNVFFDEWMPALPAPEFVVLMCIARQTYGWRRENSEMGMRQIAKRSGLYLGRVPAAVAALKKNGLIVCVPGLRGRITYRINSDVKPDECSGFPNTQNGNDCSGIQYSQESNDCSGIQYSERAQHAPDCSGIRNTTVPESSTVTVPESSTRKRNRNKSSKENSSSTDAPELSPEADEKTAAAAANFPDDAKPEEPESLSAEDSRLIAAASSAAVKAATLSSSSPLIGQMWNLARQHGCVSVQTLIDFMESRGRTNWKSHGIWLKILATDLTDYLANEPTKPVAPMVCESCENTGIAGYDGDGPMYCSCEAGKATALLNAANSESVAAPVSEAAESTEMQNAKCNECDRTGLRKANWGTVDASATFCSCEWARTLLDRNGSDYAEQLARGEREWIQRCEELDKANTTSGPRSAPCKAAVPAPGSSLAAITREDIDRILKGEPEEQVMRAVAARRDEAAA